MERIVILTGAGISRESGLNTFRDKDGIWAQVNLEDVATPQGFARDPATVQAFYNARRRKLFDPAIRPNAAHYALAHLEREWPGEVLIVTQNIDNLHERSGSRNIIHMHGSLLEALCTGCGSVSAWFQDLSQLSVCPTCNRPGALRPNVVWFGEAIPTLDQIFPALETCSLFAAIGTSGTVYPAAAFVDAARQAGAKTTELNVEESEVSRRFHESIRGPASVVVKSWVDQLLAQRIGHHA